MDAVPQLETCCCGCTFSLRGGTKIIGWVYLITAVFVMLVGIPLDILILNKMKEDPKVPEDDKKMIPMVEGILIVMGLFNLFQVFVTVLLLIGAYKNKASYLLWWIYTSLAIVILRLLGEIVTYFVNPDLADVIAWTLATALTLYFTLVVYSFYRQIRSESEANAA